MTTYSYDAVIFDLDGVITKTARVHAQSWKVVFDDYLLYRSKRYKEPLREFDISSDYLTYVDGKPRYQGVKSYLQSIDIEVPFGDPSDPPDKETICGIGNRKNSIFSEVLRKRGVEVFPKTIELVKALHEKKIRVGVASSSKNCQLILKSANIDHLFETRVDGEVSMELGLTGKPEGDIFVKAAENLGVLPARSVVVEDATSGVQAGRNGGFGFVLGVARKENENELLANGADIVVKDLGDINMEIIEQWFQKKARPLFQEWEHPTSKSDSLPPKGPAGGEIFINPCQLRAGKDLFSSGKKFVFFLDYDGTLTPIVSRPDLAVLSPSMKEVLERLMKKHMVSIVSGRMREDVQKLVGIQGIFYAGSHGFDILGPGFSMIQPKAKETIPVISTIIKKLHKELGDIPGALIEEKKFSVAVHYRLVEGQSLARIQTTVERIVSKHENVRMMSGKKVYEILPNIEWNKGKAIRWIMKALKLSWEECSVFYIGDDVTDEFAFRTIRTRGTGILVSDESKPSSADFQIQTPDDVKKLFEKIIAAA
ncbi:MAG: trehalose-phosphatase [Candidatus Omnitrophica bacterium]|nr:trehalose-phosphatase [Candidatus Omnitrophota bacterium]